MGDQHSLSLQKKPGFYIRFREPGNGLRRLAGFDRTLALARLKQILPTAADRYGIAEERAKGSLAGE
jgi:hypothetical protein